MPLKDSRTGTTLDAMTTCPVCSPEDNWVVLNLHTLLHRHVLPLNKVPFHLCL